MTMLRVTRPVSRTGHESTGLSDRGLSSSSHVAAGCSSRSHRADRRGVLRAPPRPRLPPRARRARRDRRRGRGPPRAADAFADEFGATRRRRRAPHPRRSRDRPGRSVRAEPPARPLAIRAAGPASTSIVEKPLDRRFRPAATPAPRCCARRSAPPTGDRRLPRRRRAACYAENWVYAPPVQKARRLLETAGRPILRMVARSPLGHPRPGLLARGGPAAAVPCSARVATRSAPRST